MGQLMGLPAFLVVHWIPAGESQPAMECLSFLVLHLTPSIIPLLPPGAAAPSPRHCRDAAMAIPALPELGDQDPWKYQLLWVRAMLEMHCPMDDTALGTGRGQAEP